MIRFGGSTSGFIDLTQLTNPSLVVGGHTFTITENADGSIDLGGVVGTTSIATLRPMGYNSLEIHLRIGQPFNIARFGTASVLARPGRVSMCLWNSWTATVTQPLAVLA